MSAAPLVIGSDCAPVRELAAALGGDLLALPADAHALEAWRARASAGEPYPRVVVAVWPATHARGALSACDFAQWTTRAEAPIAAWTLALGVAAKRCADGGAIVAAVERPAPLDSAGLAPEAGVAEAACALVRSLARSEGARGVRANAVASCARLAPAQPLAPAPPLASFPGEIAREFAGAVRLLLAADASGVTGQVLAADCGRSR